MASGGQIAADAPEQPATPACEFTLGPATWKVFENVRDRDGAITFISSQGRKRVLAKTAEATFAEATPPYLGLSLHDIGLANTDLLAERLLAHGDPDPEMVKSAVPPLGSARDQRRSEWTSFVGTKEAYDTAPVFYGGNTRTYHPMQEMPELAEALRSKRLFEGLLGGWMPAVRKVVATADGGWCEVIVFGDVEARDKFIVQTWHRTTLIRNGAVVRVVYGHTYPAFPPARHDPPPEAFYRALLVFADYWDRQLADLAPAALPAGSWVDITRHAFARELMVRPGGVYPKYGAVDRDYYGSEYDGFQDIFTSAVYTNLEWGRSEMAGAVIDNYFSDFVEPSGVVNMRGPETAQFGLMLSLLARYYNYTRDAALLRRHEAKIRATAGLLLALHDESLRLARTDPGFGLIHGWSEIGFLPDAASHDLVAAVFRQQRHDCAGPARSRQRVAGRSGCERVAPAQRRVATAADRKHAAERPARYDAAVYCPSAGHAHSVPRGHGKGAPEYAAVGAPAVLGAAAG